MNVKIEDTLFKKHFDGTVSVQIIYRNETAKKYLRKITQTSDFDLSDQPYHYGNYFIAIQHLEEYLKINNLF